jgi:hypothetical protein
VLSRVRDYRSQSRLAIIRADTKESLVRPIQVCSVLQLLPQCAPHFASCRRVRRSTRRGGALFTGDWTAERMKPPFIFPTLCWRPMVATLYSIIIYFHLACLRQYERPLLAEDCLPAQTGECLLWREQTLRIDFLETRKCRSIISYGSYFSSSSIFIGFLNNRF